MRALDQIRQELKVAKDRFNKFGNFKYRSCEDILEAVKPLLFKYKCSMHPTYTCKEIAGIPVIEAIIKFIDEEGKETIASAFAGVEVNKKGMDVAQSFGASSSYAEKYALNALFLIDDTKDYDSDEYHVQSQNQRQKEQEMEISKAKKELDAACMKALSEIPNAPNKDFLLMIWNQFKNTVHVEIIQKSIAAKRDQMGW